MDVLTHHISKNSQIKNLYISQETALMHESFFVLQSSGQISRISLPSGSKTLQYDHSILHPKSILSSTQISFKRNPCFIILDSSKRIYLYSIENNIIQPAELSSVQISIFLEYHSKEELKMQTTDDAVVLFSKVSCQIYLIDLITEQQASLNLKDYKKIKELTLYRECDKLCLSVIVRKPSCKTLNKTEKEISELNYVLNGKVLVLKRQKNITNDQIYQVLTISKRNKTDRTILNMSDEMLIQYKVNYKKAEPQKEPNNEDQGILTLNFTNLYINTRITLNITKFNKHDFIIKQVISLFSSSFTMLLVSKSNNIYILNCKTNELKLLAKFKNVKSILELKDNKIGVYIKRKGLFIFQLTTNNQNINIQNNYKIKNINNDDKEINTFKLLKESILNKNNSPVYKYNFNLISLLKVESVLNTDDELDKLNIKPSLNTQPFYSNGDIFEQHGATLSYKGSLTLKEKDKEIQAEIKALLKKFPFVNTSFKCAEEVINSLKITNLFSISLKENLVLKIYKSGKIIIEENNNLVFRNVFDLPLSEKNIQTEEIESGDEEDESLSDSMEDLNDFNINSVGVIFDDSENNVYIFISSKFKLLVYSLNLIKRKFVLKCSIEAEQSELKQLAGDTLGFFIKNTLLLFFSVVENRVVINCPVEGLKKKINTLLSLKLNVEESLRASTEVSSYVAKGVQIIRSETNNNFKNLTVKLNQSEKILSMENIKNKIMLINFFDKSKIRENTLLFALNYKKNYSFVKLKINEFVFVSSNIAQLFQCNSANFFFDNPNLENYKDLKMSNYLVISLTSLNEENVPLTTPTKSILLVFTLPKLLEFIKQYLITHEKDSSVNVDLKTLKEIPLEMIKSEKLEFNYPLENIISYCGFLVVSVNSILYLVGIDKQGRLNVKSMIDLMNKVMKVVKIMNLLIVYSKANVVQFVLFETKCFKAVVLDQIRIGKSKSIGMTLCNVRKDRYGLFIVDECKGTFIMINDLDNINPKIMKTVYWENKKPVRVNEIPANKCIGGIVEFENGDQELVMYDVEL